MAVTESSIELVSRYLDLDLCENDALSCEKCITLKLYLQILNNELKSAQHIIKLLQEDKLYNINLEKRDIPSRQTYADIVANRVKTTKQVNKSGTNNNNKLTNIVYPKVKSGKKQHRIIIFGDSHVKGMAAELKHNLNDDFEAIGIAKPGSTLVNIAKSTCCDTKTLKKTDVCVIWGGTNDIGKNETSAGISAMCDLVKSFKNTNVIVINVPNRHDLSPISCVNNEVQTFNRKIGKLCKIFENVVVLPVDLDRDLFTRHGLHLNTKGREHLALKVALMIKNLLTRKEKLPIALKWKVNENMNSIIKSTEMSLGIQDPPATASQEDAQANLKGCQKDLNNDKGNLNSIPDPRMKQENLGLTLKRSRRQPAKRNENFLW
jgi:hypothetical protein